MQAVFVGCQRSSLPRAQAAAPACRCRPALLAALDCVEAALDCLPRFISLQRQFPSRVFPTGLLHEVGSLRMAYACTAVLHPCVLRLGRFSGWALCSWHSVLSCKHAYSRWAASASVHLTCCHRQRGRVCLVGNMIDLRKGGVVVRSRRLGRAAHAGGGHM